VTFEGDFLSVWPINPHFLFLISTSMGLRLDPEVGVGNDVWPSDIDDVSEASVDKGLQLVGV